MREKDQISLLNEIERSFPVETLVYKGLKIWPLLRLFYVFNKNEILNSKKSKKGITLTKPLFPLSQIMKSLKVKWVDTNGNLEKLEPSDLLFVARSYNRREKYEGQYLHKYANTICSHLNQDASLSILEYSVFDVFLQPRYGKSYLINSHVYLTLLMQQIKLLVKKPSGEIHDWNSFTSKLSELHIKTNATSKSVKKTVEIILLYKDYFSKILKLVKPRAVFFTCYYSKVHMGLILAARELNIRSVEIQHGEQSIFNYKYNGWEMITKEGYLLLPSDFWVWGVQNQRQIHSWAKNTSNHKAILGGNPWLNFYFNHIYKKKKLEVDNEFRDREFKILVSLQYFEDIVKSPLIEAIKNSDHRFVWYLRHHPKLHEDRSRIAKLLKENGCENFDLDIANSLNLYQLFELVDIQITFWSTVAYEALLFGINTIIIHPYGKETFDSYIDKNHFKYSLDAKEIIDIIKNPKFDTEEERMIETSDEIIHKQLSNILQS